MSYLPCVQILMGTYNGEKFLQQQLNSILAQTYPNWELLIRDDASSDKTMDILRAYQSSYPHRFKIVEDHDGNLGGFSQNFHRLCTLSSKSIISFADQDDVWHPEKLMRSVLTLGELEERLGDDIPLLVHHDFRQIDAANQILCKSFDKAHGSRKASTSSNKLPFCNDVHGFSMTVNRSLLEVALPFPPNAMGHDGVLGCLASQIGLIEFIPEQLADYRKHDNNLSVSKSFAGRTFQRLFIDGKIEDFKSNLSAAFDDARGNIKQKQDCARSYLKTYRRLMSDDQRDTFEKFLRLDDLPFLERKAVWLQQSGLSWPSKLVAALVL